MQVLLKGIGMSLVALLCGCANSKSQEITTMAGRDPKVHHAPSREHHSITGMMQSKDQSGWELEMDEGKENLYRITFSPEGKTVDFHICRPRKGSWEVHQTKQSGKIEISMDNENQFFVAQTNRGGQWGTLEPRDAKFEFGGRDVTLYWTGDDGTIPWVRIEGVR